MNHLAAQKSLLIAESELNRTLLAADLAALRAGTRDIADQTGQLVSVTATALGLIGDLLATRGQKPPPVASGAPWLNNLIDGAGVLASVWAAFRQRRA